MNRRIVAIGRAASRPFELPVRLEPAIARLTAAGVPDRTLAGPGRFPIGRWLARAGVLATNAGIRASIDGVAVQSDGKIVVAGNAQTPSGTDSVIDRLSANGALDPAFGNLATDKSRIWYVVGQNDVAEAVTVSELPTRRIVVAGHTKTAAGDYGMAVGVLDAGGIADIGFSRDGRMTIPFNLGSTNRDVAAAVKIQSKIQTIGGFPVVTREIVLAGVAANVPNAPSHTAFALARVAFDGTLDPTFGDGGKSTFAWDVDGDGVPNDGGALAMDDQGTMTIVGGKTMVLREDGSDDLAWVVARVVLEP
jgi:uncharacterized delta-60 repeat protein